MIVPADPGACPRCGDPRPPAGAADAERAQPPSPEEMAASASYPATRGGHLDGRTALTTLEGMAYAAGIRAERARAATRERELAAEVERLKADVRDEATDTKDAQERAGELAREVERLQRVLGIMQAQAEREDAEHAAEVDGLRAHAARTMVATTAALKLFGERLAPLGEESPADVIAERDRLKVELGEARAHAERLIADRDNGVGAWSSSYP